MKLKLSLLIVLTLSFSSAYAKSITSVPNFGNNPGGIDMYKYVPANMPANAPLVISLHGCDQDADTYSKVGWKALADEWKFYLIIPEQNISNNIVRCWNWFQAKNIKRGHGESKSIIQMIEKMQDDYSIDVGRIFIEGLSAGGWMVSALLASYPDVFAGGATNAGGPAFCALTEKHFWDVFGGWYLYRSFTSAKKCMQGTDKSPDEWGDLVRDEGYDGFTGPWPVISIWQGSADETVNKINQQEMVDQWTNVHGIDQVFDRQEKSGNNANVTHKEYQNDAGKVLVETYLIQGMTHGTPIAVDPDVSCGEADTYILDVGICAVRYIGHFWKLDG